MKHCCQLNTIFTLVVYCLFLHGELHGYVRAFSSDTHDTGEKENADPLSIPLVNDKGAPLVAMLDTNTINRKIKSYIKTLMRNMIQNSMQEHMRGIFKSSLEEDATIDFIRNITLQEINDALSQQVQEHGEDKSTLMRDMIQSSIQEQIQGIFKTSLEENSTIDFIRNITLQEIKEQGKEVISLPTVAQYKDCTELQRQTKKKLNDGVYTIYPGVAKPVHAYCDMTTDGEAGRYALPFL
ncbi:unnamed protein product [Mytilus edulis]|uniref:Uncharacterized protein n=1 Tax=Mytilus edulis TaxID=6550 RepID=A0A8S3S3T6_MYTED|nr:unnamed protein product [Mytilus edulis]